MLERFLKLLLILTAVSCLSGASFPRSRSFVKVRPGETHLEILTRAANVIPSYQQYEWQKMEFIAFVHFGMDTFTGEEPGTGKESPALFNPSSLDCDQWARTFKAAGMKMAIITAKHHDGFCLWPSKYTEHSVKNSPWRNGKGDVVREFVNACRKYGLKVGFYLSPWDRNYAAYGTPAYNRYFMNQLTELLSNYGRISEVWFDGYRGPGAEPESYDWHSYYRLIRKLQPGALIAVMGPDIRWVGTESGEGRKTEWDVIPLSSNQIDTTATAYDPSHPIDNVFVPQNFMGPDLGSRKRLYDAKYLFWYPSETDVSIRPGWFYHESQDTLVKSVADLVNIYFTSVGRNSVLLLNVPPDKRGLITRFDADTLEKLHGVISRTFAKNVLKNAKFEIDNRGKLVASSSVFGGGKSWIAPTGVDTASLRFNLPKRETFDVAMLQENILIGQRIGKFHIDYWDGHAWRFLTGGTTVGYKRLLRFKPVTTTSVRLAIERSRLNPTLSSFGLYMLPTQYLNTGD